MGVAGLMGDLSGHLIINHICVETQQSLSDYHRLQDSTFTAVLKQGKVEFVSSELTSHTLANMLEVEGSSSTPEINILADTPVMN